MVLLDVLGAEVAGREPASVPEGQGVTALPPGQELLLAPLHRPGEAAEPGRLRPPNLRRRSPRGGGRDADRLLVHAPRHGCRSFSHPDVHLVLCGPSELEHVREACRALEAGPLDEDEMAWMRRVGDHVYRRAGLRRFSR